MLAHTHTLAHPYTVDIPERRYARGVRIRSKRPPDREKGNRRAPEIPWPTAKHPTTKKPSDSTVSTPSKDLPISDLFLLSLRAFRPYLRLVSPCLAPIHPQIPFSNCVSIPSTTHHSLAFFDCRSNYVLSLLRYHFRYHFRYLVFPLPFPNSSTFSAVFAPDDLVRSSLLDDQFPTRNIAHPVFVKRAVCND